MLVMFSLILPWFPVAGMRDVTIENGNIFIHTVDVAL